MKKLASSVIALGVLLLVTPAAVVADAPLLIANDVTVEATGPGGAAVTYDLTASDDNGPPQIDCTQPDGSTFSLGTTVVTCTATDTVTQEISQVSFNVTVQDTTPPTLNLPSPIAVEATGPGGATVSYSASAFDIADPSVAANCSPGPGSTFPLGSTTVNCTATDNSSNTASDSFTVTVHDTTPPVITVPGNVTVEATGPAGSPVTYSGVSATDTVSGSLTPSCLPASGSTFPLGTTTVTCTATDSSSNTGNGSFTVAVQDTTPPVITVPGNVTVEATGPDGAPVTYSGVSATDTISGALTPACSPPSGSTFPLGTTTVTCTATDGSGNSASGHFDVTVRDTTPPVLSVPSPITVEATGPGGATVTYSATASDAVSGALTPACSPPSGSTFALGTTTVSCKATDGSGNKANGSFTVTVKDTTAPTLTVPPPISAEATSPDGAIVSFSVTATDVVSGNLKPSCSPDSGSMFPLGTTTVNCTATDGAGNKTSAAFTVTVQDTLAPALTVPAQITSEATDANGSVVTYTMPTALDLVDGPVPVTCTPKPGSRFPLGLSSVNCQAVDLHGNKSVGSFFVDIVDTTPPILTVPAPITVSSKGASALPATDSVIAAFLSGATARDIVSGALIVTNDAPSTFPLGTTTVTFSTQDSSSNPATGTSTVTVVTQPVTQPSRPVDRTPPDDVRGLTAKIGDHSLTLSWRRPTAIDFDHVKVTRSANQPAAAEKLVYSGLATKLVDKRVKNGVDYRYVVVSYDHAGNRSAGVALVAAPKTILLVRPADGARVTAAPTLLWAPFSGADYYNVQLFRGNQKIYSNWLKANKLKLPMTWVYLRRRYRLTAGFYRWYVFPGIGPRGDAKYAPLLGQSTFVIVPAKKKK